MSSKLHKMLKSFLLVAILLPAMAFANTEFKGTETVNINRADAATLAAYLKGVGVNRAKDIVSYRNKNGKFKSIEDLKNVPGIGEETFKDNKRKLSTSRGKTSAPEGFKLGKASGKTRKTSKSSSSKKSSSRKSTSSKRSSASSKDDDKTSSSKRTRSTSKKKSASDKSSTRKSSSKTSSKKSTTKKKSSSASSKKTKAKKPKKTTRKSKSKKRTTKKKK